MRPRELLILRRDAGYVRVHVPPLLYVPSLAKRLELALTDLPGVRRVVADRHRARISVWFDPEIQGDRALLVAIRDGAEPLMGRMDRDAFELAFAEQAVARRERLTGKAAQAAYLGLLTYAHLHVLRWAIRRPATAWWAWALLGFAIYTHRRQIRRIPSLQE